MSAHCEQSRRSQKTSPKAGTRLSFLGAGLSLLLSLSSGCTKVVVCKAETMAQLPEGQYCADCKPLDHELLARLNTTELPWPVRKAVDDCADWIHNPGKEPGAVAGSAPRSGGIVTKGALRRCLGRTSNLDGPTQSGLIALVNKSNLPEDEDQSNFNAKCDKSVPIVAPAAMPLPPPAPMPMPADSGMQPAAPAPGAMPAPTGMPPAPAPSALPPALPPPSSAPVLPPPPPL